MREKFQRNMRNLAFAFRIGATFRNKLTLAKMLTKHIAVHRGWSTFTNEPQTVQALHKGKSFTVDLRDNATDIIIFEDVFNRRCYELPDTAFTSIVDAGANIGIASLYFSLVHPGATITSFEPVEHAMCKRNARNVLECALGKQAGSINILIDPQNSGGHRLEIYDADPSLQRIKVPIHRLDELIAEGKINPPDLLKIDAEGAECDILEGLGEHIKTLRALVAEAQSQKNHEWIMNHVRSHGFTKMDERILHPTAHLPGDAYSIIVARR